MDATSGGLYGGNQPLPDADSSGGTVRFLWMRQSGACTTAISLLKYRPTMITIQIDGADIAAALQCLASGMARPGPVMPVVAGILHDAVMEDFAQSGRPR